MKDVREAVGGVPAGKAKPRGVLRGSGAGAHRRLPCAGGGQVWPSAGAVVPCDSYSVCLPDVRALLAALTDTHADLLVWLPWTVSSLMRGKTRSRAAVIRANGGSPGGGREDIADALPRGEPWPPRLQRLPRWRRRGDERPRSRADA
ncbi:MAG: hypothetical protein ACLTDR_09755 [Adlercreutzia equolifaciens]